MKKNVDCLTKRLFNFFYVGTTDVRTMDSLVTSLQTKRHLKVIINFYFIKRRPVVSKKCFVHQKKKK